MADMANTNTNTIEVECSIPFTWAVDTAIKSDTSSNFEASPRHSFASVVDGAIRSSPSSSFSISTLDAFPLPIITDPLTASHDNDNDNVWPYGNGSFTAPGVGEFTIVGRFGEINSVNPPILEAPPKRDPLLDSVSRDDETQEASSALIHHIHHNPLPNGIGSWQKGKMLGNGLFGTVYEGFTDSGYFFAVKEVSLLDEGALSKQTILQLQQEISLLSRFRHDNIVRYLGTQKDDYNLYMFVELLTQGSLTSLYQKYHLTESQVSAYTKQILSGLKYLHDRNMVHRDIKCANILVDVNNSVRLSNFGLAKEISLLGHFKHENIVQYLGTDMVNDKLYIFLELVTKGSLANLYRKYQLTDSQVSKYTRQILSGLKYLHEHNMVHRDIKCGNILVDINGSVKLADFGLAKLPFFSKSTFSIQQLIGSVYWMAPEVVMRNCGYGLPADIWSLGCTVLEMLTRQPPYSHLEGVQAMFRIGRGELPHVPESLSRDARDFILKCLQVNPNERPTAAQLLDHPFVKRPLLSLTLA